MVRTQRDVMRELWARFDGDESRVVAAYAAAERHGDAPRLSNIHGVDRVTYARALLADGLKKGWLAAADLAVSAPRIAGTPPLPKPPLPGAADAEAATSGSAEGIASAPAQTGVTVPLDLGGLSTPNLLQLSAGVIEELRRRRVVRSSNNPVADYAEFLAARAFDLDLAARSEAGYDGKDAEGRRYQVKARRLTAANPSRQLGFIRGLDADPFDLLVAILFNGNYTILRAALIPVSTVRVRATWVEYVRAWRLVLTEPTFALEGVQDVTEEVRSAAAVDILISAHRSARRA